jgi:hypothetical protein
MGRCGQGAKKQGQQDGGGAQCAIWIRKSHHAGNSAMFVRGFMLSMAFVWAGPLGAHEYWVEPMDFTLEAGQPMQANLKVGQNFAGSPQPFISALMQSFTISNAAATQDYVGRIGDIPALSVAEPKVGLNVLAFVSNVSRLQYVKPDLLERYLKLEGLDPVLEAHRAAGWPEVGFFEEYTRNAKALVQVGPYTGDSDVAVGMTFELVAQGSPYAPTAHDVRVQLLLRGVPQPDWPINVFTKNVGGVLRTRAQTDKDGFAVVPFPEGAHVMLNSVFIQRSSPESEAFYESWWASLTFGR